MIVKFNETRYPVFLLLVLVIVFFSMSDYSYGLQSINYGDINDDGKINVQDAVLVMKHVLGLELLDDEQQRAADVNGDGAINIRDVYYIMQYSLGLIDKLPMMHDDQDDYQCPYDDDYYYYDDYYYDNDDYYYDDDDDDDDDDNDYSPPDDVYNSDEPVYDPDNDVIFIQ